MSRSRDSAPIDFFRSDRYAPVPVSRKKTGAHVGDPAREEQRRAGARRVGRADPGDAEEVARVVERHDDHDRAADQVDRFEASAGRSAGCRHAQ